MSGLLSAVEVFMTKTPLPKPPCWSAATGVAGNLHACLYKRMHMYDSMYRCGEMVAHAAVLTNTGLTARFYPKNANKPQTRSDKRPSLFKTT